MRLITVARVLAIVVIGGLAVTSAQRSSVAVVASVAGGNLSLSNGHIKASWRVTDGRLAFVESSDAAARGACPRSCSRSSW